MNITLDFFSSSIIYSTATLFILSAMAVNRIIILRLLYLVGSILFTIYGFKINAPEIIFWNSASMLINSTRILFYFFESNTWFLKKAELSLYNSFFKQFMLPGQFRKIIQLADVKLYQDTVILEENVYNKDLYFVIHIEGQLLVQSKSFHTELHEYSFFGEMSFLKNQKTNALVKVLGSATCYYWDAKNLNSLKTRYPQIYNNLILILSHDLVQKLTYHTLR